MKNKCVIQFNVITLLLCIFLSSCANNPQIFIDNNHCIGSFNDYAYGTKKSDEITTSLSNKYVNSDWIIEGNLPDQMQTDEMTQKISGERVIGTELELWIRSIYGSNTYYSSDRMLYENKISIYNTSLGEWKSVNAIVHDCNCIADELFFDIDGNIWAKNAGNIDDNMTGVAPVLSKYNPILNQFELIDETKGIFSGTIGEIYEDIYYSDVIYDGIDSIWIIPRDGKISVFNIKNEKLRSTDLMEGMTINSVTYDKINKTIYLMIQKSYKMNLLRIPSDYEIVKLFIDDEQSEVITHHPYYWPNYSHLWVDQSGSLWFDTFGYMDSDYNWHLLMTNIGEYVYNTYFDRNLSYVPQKIITGTSDGKLWFDGSGGIAWYNIHDSTGCWDSRYGMDVYEDSNQKIWFITKDSLYYRKN